MFELRHPLFVVCNFRKGLEPRILFFDDLLTVVEIALYWARSSRLFRPMRFTWKLNKLVQGHFFVLLRFVIVDCEAFEKL